MHICELNCWSDLLVVLAKTANASASSCPNTLCEISQLSYADRHLVNTIVEGETNAAEISVYQWLTVPEQCPSEADIEHDLSLICFGNGCLNLMHTCNSPALVVTSKHICSASFLVFQSLCMLSQSADSGQMPLSIKIDTSRQRYKKGQICRALMNQRILISAFKPECVPQTEICDAAR